MADEERYADKIAKLLRKAEGTDNPHEAETFMEAAQQLMTKYAISEELLAKARGLNREEAEEIVEERITYRGVYNAALYDIGAAVARANNCRVLISKGYGGKTTILHLIGHKSDVERVKMLDTSVQIQATGALTKWARDGGVSSWMSASDKYKARRTFLFGFAHGLTIQLAAAAKAGQQDAADDFASERHVSQDEANDSVALVVRDRKQRVEDWVDQRYGKTLRTVSRNYASGGYDASLAGSNAGRRADVSGRGKVGGSPRSLTR